MGTISANYSKNIKNFKTLLLTFCCALFFSLQAFALPDCSSISPIANACPDGSTSCTPNCWYLGLPLCGTLSATPVHRTNCIDLLDLPLCSQMDSPASAYAKVNCIPECSTILTGTGVRGVDYAVHGVDCIRFKGASESGIVENCGNYTPGSAVNCVIPKCHQLPSTATPIYNGATPNCTLLDCNRLTPDELNETKFDDDLSTKKYCQGDNVKCYNFTYSQLSFLRSRVNNTMCVLHDCDNFCHPPLNDSSNVGGNLTAATTPTKNDYIARYKLRVGGGEALENNIVCNPVQCRPVIQRAYRCAPVADAYPTVKNVACDAASSCVNGYCYKTIDCNDAANAGEQECLSTSPSSAPATIDTTQSWFYRPVPEDSARDGGSANGYKTIAEDLTNGGLCYTGPDYSGYEFGGYWTGGCLGALCFPRLFWHNTIFHDTSSPGICNTTNGGNRGTGYIYLCGNGGSLYSDVSSKTAYIRGYVSTQYGENSGSHKVTVCLRFKNAMRPDVGGSRETCGARECIGSCAGGCSLQHCGFDECRDLVIDDNNPSECMYNDDLFNNNGDDHSCISRVDSYLRVRAVKYQNRVCAFLDVKGQLAYNGGMFFDGSEILSDGTCLGTGVVGGTCSAKSSRDSQGQANVWRSTLMVPYIGDNIGSPYGFLDRASVLHKQQECIATPLRISPPRMYNLATSMNSNTLFGRAVYILNARVAKGGAISTPTVVGDVAYGLTDFNLPAMEVKFGNSSQILSLDIGKTGYELSTGTGAGAPDPNASATINATVNGLQYSVEVFVKKERSDSQNPLFCLYRKVKAADGSYLTPERVGCVKRRYPEINSADIGIEATPNPRKVVIAADSTNSASSAKLKLTYFAGKGANGVDNNCASGSDDICSSAITLENANILSETCDEEFEKYKTCVKRDACTALNMECMQNELNINDALNAAPPQSTTDFDQIRNQCNNVILKDCNARKGITTSASSTIINSDPNATSVGNAYGWFNELCVSQGFDTKLKNVFAYDAGNILGKCIVSGTSPYLTDGNSSTNCNAGGKAPNCLCSEALPGDAAPSGQVIRKQTPREAGLCIDIPIPLTCSAINYNPTPNAAPDEQYVAFSLNGTVYGTTIGTVHTSHQSRSGGSASGYGEFPKSFAGTSGVKGQCNGFWKNNAGGGGATFQPTLSCTVSSGVASWTGLTNACTRYSCPPVSTNDPGSGGYVNGYTIPSEASDDTQGQSHGFALWNGYAKTNDFPESVSASACIVGYKKIGSAAVGSTPNITGYSGGSSPTRNCNQLGQWQTTSNNCARITCPAISAPVGGSLAQLTAWASDAGGAEFTATNASRSATVVRPESIKSGTCKTSLGFYQLGSSPPSRQCDSLGNWLTVQNPCTTMCSAVDSATGNNLNHGFATWAQITGIPLGGQSTSTASACLSGYVQNPYPPILDINGNIRADANNLGRPSEMPQRLCKTSSASSGAAIWNTTTTSCINKCPGACPTTGTPTSYCDDRIGVGKTQHNTSGGVITISWPEANFGDTVYYISGVGATTDPNTITQNAANYAQSRTNGFYILKRVCGSSANGIGNGRWDSNVVAGCATNSGIIGDSNAIYGFNYTSPLDKFVGVTGYGAPVTGTCLAGFSKTGSQTGGSVQDTKTYQCQFESGNTNIDKTYYAHLSGSPCIKLCSATNGNAPNGSYPGSLATATATYASGSNITLSCAAGNGKAIGTSRNVTVGEAGVCNLPSSYTVHDARSGGHGNYTVTVTTDRVSSFPTATCQADGTWTVNNACSVCRGCNSGSVLLDNTEFQYHSWKGSADCTVGNRLSNVISKFATYGCSVSRASGTSFSIGETFYGAYWNWMCAGRNVQCIDNRFLPGDAPVQECGNDWGSPCNRSCSDLGIAHCDGSNNPTSYGGSHATYSIYEGDCSFDN